MVVEVLLLHDEGEAVDPQVAHAPKDEAHSAEGSQISPRKFITDHALEACCIRTSSILLESTQRLLDEGRSILEEHSLCRGCLEHI